MDKRLYVSSTILSTMLLIACKKLTTEKNYLQQTIYSCRPSDEQFEETYGYIPGIRFSVEEKIVKKANSITGSKSNEVQKVSTTACFLYPKGERTTSIVQVAKEDGTCSLLYNGSRIETAYNASDNTAQISIDEKSVPASCVLCDGLTVCY